MTEEIIIPIPVTNIVDKEKAQDDYDNVMMDIADLKRELLETFPPLVPPPSPSQ